MSANRRVNGRPWLIALLSNLAIAGLARAVFLREYAFAGRYLLAIAVAMFCCMLSAVVLAVWQERAGLAGTFVLLTGALAALLFYRQELTVQLPLAELIIGVVTVASWFLAAIGCQLRRRLREMD